MDARLQAEVNALVNRIMDEFAMQAEVTPIQSGGCLVTLRHSYAYKGKPIVFFKITYEGKRMRLRTLDISAQLKSTLSEMGVSQ